MHDIGKAFSFPFKDPQWASKFVLAGLVLLLCLVGIGIFVMAGYLVQVTQRVMRREEQPLPEWSDLGVKFVVGFKFCVVYFMYILPIFLLSVPLIGLAAASEISGQSAVFGIMSVVYTFAFTLIVVPYSLALSVVLPVICYRFAARERISDALDVGGIFSTFKASWQSTLVVALLSVGVQSFAFIGVLVFVIGILFTIFYAYLVSAYLNGALYLDQTEAGVRLG